MNDIGDDVTVSTTITVDGVPADPGTVDLAVTAPDGTVTTPSVGNPAVGSYEATVPATSAGRWLYAWTTTDPAGVEHGHFDVAADPPPPDRLAPLATTTDLEDRLGRSLTDVEARKAPALLRDASAKVRAYTRQDFDLTLGDVAVLRPVGTELRLPQRPVLDVTAVVAVGGAPGIPDLPLSGWTWDGLDIVDIAGLDSNVWVSLPAWWEDHGTRPNTYRVTWDHGYPVTPDDVVEVVCSMINRVLLAPTPVEGMNREQIGQYGYGMAGGGGSPGVRVRLTQEDRDALADAGYRRRSGTIQMRT